MSRNERMYLEVWKIVRDTGKVRLSAPPETHARIYKAIRKEKDMDMPYKHLLAEQGESARLTSASVGMVLTITLIIGTSTKNMTADILFK